MDTSTNAQDKSWEQQLVDQLNAKRASSNESDVTGAVTASAQTATTTNLDAGAAQSGIDLLTKLNGAYTGDISAQIKPLLSQVENQFNNDTLGQISQLATRVGSKMNTFLPAVIEKGRSDYRTNEAAIIAQAVLNDRTASLQAAPNIITALKGAQTTSSVTGREENQSTLNKLIASLEGTVGSTTGTSESDSTKTGNTQETPDLLDWLKGTIFSSGSGFWGNA